MNKKNKTKLSATENISNITQLPFDMAMGLPYIKMSSNREVLIEDAGNIVHYDESCVKVRQRKNVVFVSGNNLKLIYLVNNDLRVTGFITCVGFE